MIGPPADSLADAEQLDVKNQSRVARNGGITGGAIAERRRNDQSTLSADSHGGEPFIPALDHLSLAEGETEGSTSVNRAVELAAVAFEPTSIVDVHRLPSQWRWPA